MRAAHALRRIAAAALLRKASRELVLAARAPALDAREPSLAAFARQRSLHASQRSLRALASACCARLPALDPASHRSLREASTLGVALVARELALAAREAPHALREAVRAVAQLTCCPHATAVPCLRPCPFVHCS